MSSASASEVVGGAWAASLVAGALLPPRVGKLALKLRYRSSLGFWEFLLWYRRQYECCGVSPRRSVIEFPVAQRRRRSMWQWRLSGQRAGELTATAPRHFSTHRLRNMASRGAL